MIDLFFQIVLNNICISLVLAIIAAVVGITLKHPTITHLLWLLVFVKLLTPPLLNISAIPTQWADEPTPSVHLNIDEQPVMQSAVFSESIGINNLPPETVPINPIQGKHLILILWALGSMAVLIWSTLQVYRFHRMLKKESETGSPGIQSTAKKIAASLGLKTVPEIHTVSANISPMIWWIGGKVWVVIPASIVKQLSTEQFKWILSHELAHMRRRDYMIRWIEWLVCVCFWWNPVTWWARYNLRANEELCCDAMVLSTMKPKPYTYGDSLLKAIEIITWPPQQPFVVASGINNGGLLRRRVKMIVSNDLIKSKLRWLQACIMLGAMIVLPLGLTNAQQNPVTTDPTASDDLSHNSQVVEIDKEIADLMARIDEINNAIEVYRSRIEETPKREEEILSLKRDYENLQAAYNSLVERRLEAETAMKIEKESQGGKFQANEEMAQGTLDFLSDEQKAMKIRLKQKEEELRTYKEKHMGSLPEQLDSNLDILRDLTKELEQYNSSLRDAENRRTAIVRDASASEAPISQGSSSSGQTWDVADLASLKNELANLQSRYSENHPDVIRLKEIIAVLEKEREQASKQMEAPLDE